MERVRGVRGRAGRARDKGRGGQVGSGGGGQGKGANVLALIGEPLQHIQPRDSCHCQCIEKLVDAAGRDEGVVPRPGSPSVPRRRIGLAAVEPYTGGGPQRQYTGGVGRLGLWRSAAVSDDGIGVGGLRTDQR